MLPWTCWDKNAKAVSCVQWIIVNFSTLNKNVMATNVTLPSIGSSGNQLHDHNTALNFQFVAGILHSAAVYRILLCCKSGRDLTYCKTEAKLLTICNLSTKQCYTLTVFWQRNSAGSSNADYADVSALHHVTMQLCTVNSECICFIAVQRPIDGKTIWFVCHNIDARSRIRGHRWSWASKQGISALALRKLFSLLIQWTHLYIWHVGLQRANVHILWQYTIKTYWATRQTASVTLAVFLTTHSCKVIKSFTTVLVMMVMEVADSVL